MPHTEMMEERLRLLEIDHDTLSNLRIARDILKPEIDSMLDNFYSHIANEPELQAFFVDNQLTERARAEQKSHWLALLDGKFDEAYFEKTIQIGRAHSRMGLTPDMYFSGYYQMFGNFVELISKEYASKNKPAVQVIQAFSKAVFLDMDLVISCYLDDKDSMMRNILQRATDFRKEMWKFSDNLNTLATKIKTRVEALSTSDGSRLEPGDETSKSNEELLEPVKKLNQQTKQLDKYLKSLPLREKLYIEDETSKSWIFSRLIAMVSAKS